MTNYFRKITALLPKENWELVINRHIALRVRALLFVVLVISAGILLQVLVFLQQKMVQSKKEYEVHIKEFRYWNGVVSQFPNIPDILYNASVSALSIGRRDDALHYIDKALKIDPLFKKARELRNEIVKDG